MTTKLRKIIFTVFMAFMLAFPAFASVQTPVTGDTQGRYMSIVIAALGISLVIIIVLLIVSAKGKKK